MKRRTLLYSLSMILLCALAILGLIWAITSTIYEEAVAPNITEEFDAPLLGFEGKYTVETVAAKIGVVGISQSANITNTQKDTFISLSINGVLVDFGESKPIVYKGLTIVPIKEVFEQLGFELVWNEETKSVTATNAENKIVFTIGQMLYLANNEPFMLDTPAQIIEGKTMVPLRAVLDCVGAKFEWMESGNLIKLTVNGSVEN